MFTLVYSFIQLHSVIDKLTSNSGEMLFLKITKVIVAVFSVDFKPF